MKAIVYLLVFILFPLAKLEAAGFEPAYLNLTDGIMLTPSISTRWTYDDNVYRRETDIESAHIYQIIPSLLIANKDQLNPVGFVYLGQFAQYSNNDNDNYRNHNAKLFANFNKNSRHKLRMHFSHTLSHEARGTGFSELDENLFPEPVKYKESEAYIDYQYGAKSAQSRISSSLKHQKRVYSNFREITRLRDVDITSAQIEFDYKLAKLSSMVLDIQAVDNQYKVHVDTENSLDNQDYFALLGFVWDIQAKTTGIAKFGYQQKQFENENRQDFNGTTFDISLTWQPLRYSVFNLSANKSSKNPNTVGDYIKQQSVALDWAHEWSYRVSSNIGIGVQNRVLVGTTREDDQWRGRLGVNYLLYRWFKLSLSYEFVEQNSTVSDISYDKNSISLNINVGL